jgi:DNA polymerase I-like protein with 3'-5' exonuclease and polymerase domains
METTEVTLDDLKTKKPKKAKVVKVKKDVKTLFTEHMATLTVEDLKKPWMAEKSFRLITDAAELEQWVQGVLADTSRHHTFEGRTCPVIAVDTETDGLDTRLVCGEKGISLAGVCLSADGIEGLYIPVNHEDGQNIDAVALKAILQRLFDASHLVFYNAKFDREVLSLTLGITFKDYPNYEDLQVLAYLEDPKASVEDSGKGGLQIGGLKAFSRTRLGIEQVELGDIAKVRASVWNEELQKNTMRVVVAPFTWVPTEFAKWYAAGDAITTWLGWDLVKEKARSLGSIHRVDHLLIDTLAWIERQRIDVDVDLLKETIAWHKDRLIQLTEELGALAEWDAEAEGAEFNPGSSPQLVKILFEKRGMTPLALSEKTGIPSTAIGVLTELKKLYPDDIFLDKLMSFREYAALHPDNLKYDPRDNSARFYFKQNVVAGGRLAAAGGDFEKDGGCGVNIQAIKKVGGNWWVKGRKLTDQSKNPVECTQHPIEDLDTSCWNKDKELAPNITNNHIGVFFGRQYCLVPTCTECEGEKTKVDANEVLNLRSLFRAPKGWTLYCIDFSNIEMRVAANISKEPLFIKEFLEGSGDFHSLTATALFPEFSDPTVDIARKKALRSLAKIINFALLYGGTAYTIFENMVKEGHAITFEGAQLLVEKYWESVPTFAAWCSSKRETARTKLMCKTPTGRVISFLSAMNQFHITPPKPEDKDNFFLYKKLSKAAENFKKLGHIDDYKATKMQADALYNNKTTGVKNFTEYNRFLGKAERVSINIPLQGTAGDLMRSALNKIRIWATTTPYVEDIFKLHCTVHDEIDFSVKDEFAPYVLPRLNRFMKLRKLHESKGWTVPIETDCEYGQSWDVDYHLTGDDSHKPSGWYDIEGMDSYIPGEYDSSVVDSMVKSLSKGKLDKVTTWLTTTLHPRTHGIIKHITEAKTEAEWKRFVTIMLQLDEFWKLDEDEAGAFEESVEEFMVRTGAKLPEKVVFLPKVKVEVAVEKVSEEEAEDLAEVKAPENDYDDNDEDPFYEPAKKVEAKVTPEEVVTVESPKIESKTKDPIPEVRPILDTEFPDFIKALGIGRSTIKFQYKGIVMQLSNVEQLPKEYLL